MPRWSTRPVWNVNSTSPQPRRPDCRGPDRLHWSPEAQPVSAWRSHPLWPMQAPTSCSPAGRLNTASAPLPACPPRPGALCKAAYRQQPHRQRGSQSARADGPYGAQQYPRGDDLPSLHRRAATGDRGQSHDHIRPLTSWRRQRQTSNWRPLRSLAEPSFVRHALAVDCRRWPGP